MPYISQDTRTRIAEDAPGRPIINTVGELTYILTMTILDYLKQHDLRFDTIAEVRGALASTLSEFDRRVAFPYENRKKLKNGDVYPPKFTR